MKNSKFFAEKANDIVENNIGKGLTKERLMAELINSYNEGVFETLNKSQTGKSQRQVVKKFQESLSETFIENVGPEFLNFVFDLVEANQKNRILSATWKENATVDLQNLIQAIYDLGFLNGAEVAQDPECYKLYVKHRESIANGEQ